MAVCARGVLETSTGIKLCEKRTEEKKERTKYESAGVGDYIKKYIIGKKKCSLVST